MFDVIVTLTTADKRHFDYSYTFFIIRIHHCNYATSPRKRFGLVSLEH